jgi:CubicO group peptidase (beta-lactamase class C family)
MRLLRSVAVPRDLAPITTIGERESDPARASMTAAGVECIWRSAERLYRSGMYPALTLCVMRDGHVVLDRALGWARGGAAGQDEEGVAATPDTPFCIFSASKAVTATVIHLLAERRLLTLGDRVVDHLPEFAGEGRDDVTIAQVLAHRAGVPELPRDMMDLERLEDPERILEAIPQLRHRYRPGAVAYHAVSGGFVLGEIVRRVTGDDIRTVLAREILRPLGLRWLNYGVAAGDVPAVGPSYVTGPPLLPPLSTLATRALGLPWDDLVELSNDPRFLTGIVPAGNVVATAYEMARFMELLRCGGTLDDIEILEPRTIRRALVETSYHEFDRTLGFPARYSYGYLLGARALSVFGPDTDEAFGHLGFTNVLMWADPRRRLSVGLVTNGKPAAGPHLPRLWALVRRIGLEGNREP